MSMIVLSPRQQDQLGKKLTPLEIEQARLQEQAVVNQRQERDWLKDDTLPGLSDCLSFKFFADIKKSRKGRKSWRGVLVIEFLGCSTSRSGEVVGMVYSTQYEQELSIVQWLNGLTSFSHPEVSVLQRQQLSLF
jgi:hypothetical protein